MGRKLLRWVKGSTVAGEVHFIAVHTGTDTRRLWPALNRVRNQSSMVSHSKSRFLLPRITHLLDYLLNSRLQWAAAHKQSGHGHGMRCGVECDESQTRAWPIGASMKNRSTGVTSGQVGLGNWAARVLAQARKGRKENASKI
jgi:hypothetical protein